MKLVSALFLLLAIILAVLNPSPEEFTTFFREQAAERGRQAGRDAGNSAGGGAIGFLTERLGEAVANTAGGRLGEEFEHENYILFSTYTLDVNGSRENGIWRFLGIGGQFVSIQEPDINEL